MVEAGTFNLTATGAISGYSVSNTVTVLAPAAAPAAAVEATTPGTLPYMGFDERLLPLALLGGGLAAVGAVSILVVKRGKTAEPETA